MLYPYAISRESVNGHRVWIAKSLHLKGCVAQGDTRLEAIKELESNEIAWLKTARMLHIPQSNYSIYTLSVRWSFFIKFVFCATKIISLVFINVDGECGQLYI